MRFAAMRFGAQASRLPFHHTLYDGRLQSSIGMVVLEQTS
jgi:hypothetical protein